MKASLRTKILLGGLTFAVLGLVVEVVRLRFLLSPELNENQSMEKVAFSPDTPIPKEPGKKVIFSIGRGQGERLLDEGGFEETTATFALCADEILYTLIFEAAQPNENTYMTFGRYFGGELIDHRGIRFRPEKRANFSYLTPCVFMRGIKPESIKSGHLSLCDNDTQGYERCRDSFGQNCPSSVLNELRSKNLLADSSEIMKCRWRPVVDNIFLTDLVSRKGKSCFYGSYLQINRVWMPMDGFSVEYKKYDEQDQQEHCWIEGGEVFDEESYFDNNSSRVHIELTFWFEGRLYVLVETTQGESMVLTLYRFQDGKAEYVASGGGYNVPL